LRAVAQKQVGAVVCLGCTAGGSQRARACGEKKTAALEYAHERQAAPRRAARALTIDNQMPAFGTRSGLARLQPPRRHRAQRLQRAVGVAAVGEGGTQPRQRSFRARKIHGADGSGG